MVRAKINKDKCKGCMLCVVVCPGKLIKKSKKLNKKGLYPAEIAEPEKCIACAMCALMCPDMCIEVYK